MILSPKCMCNLCFENCGHLEFFFNLQSREMEIVKFTQQHNYNNTVEPLQFSKENINGKL